MNFSSIICSTLEPESNNHLFEALPFSILSIVESLEIRHSESKKHWNLLCEFVTRWLTSNKRYRNGSMHYYETAIFGRLVKTSTERVANNLRYAKKNKCPVDGKCQKWEIVVAVTVFRLQCTCLPTHLFVFLAYLNWKLSVIKYIQVQIQYPSM